MNAPYNGRFKVSQEFKGMAHDGLDLVGIDSKEIHSTVTGTVTKAGWENTLMHVQGFGLYVRIRKSGTSEDYYFGHLSQLKVKAGQAVKVGDLIGIEGSTGRSTGSHCHYCARINCNKKRHLDICKISGIPNTIGIYDDGYLARQKAAAKAAATPVAKPTPKPTASKITYFSKYGGQSASIVTALKALGNSTAFAYRAKIAAKNGISGYTGTAQQNTYLLSLLKQGKLIKP